MLNKLCLVLSVLLAASLVLAACTPAAAPTAAPIHPTTAGAATASAAPAAAAAPVAAPASIKAGLVTDTGGVKDQGFNQLAWEGLQKAAQELGFPAKYLESAQPSDYERNIDALAGEGYTVIFTVGAQMAEATALKAKQYPNIRFAILDYAYAPTPGSPYCPDTASDCYAAGGLSNVTSLMFAVEQSGFLAGVLAGGMSKSGFVCSISSLRTPESDRYVISFRAGATWQAGPEMKIMNNYINIQTADANVPTSADATQGKETALRLIGKGCDVVFAVGGPAVSGVLLAARESSLPAIAADIDPYNTAGEARPALISSALKKADGAVYDYLKALAAGTASAGIRIASLQNGGAGLAPFHDWDSQVPAELKAQLQQASAGVQAGAIQIDLP